MKVKSSCVLLVVGLLAGCNHAPGTTPPAGNTAAPAGSPAASAQPAAGPGAPDHAPVKPVAAQIPNVVARVNGQDVEKTDFDRMVHTIEQQAGQPIPPDRRDEVLRGALDRLIEYTVLSQEARKRGIKIDDSEINAKMQQLRGQFPTEEAFNKALKDRGLTPEVLRRQAQVDLSVNKLMEGEVSTLPGPSDADVRAFYDKNPDKFKQDEQVRASHILIHVDPKADAATKKRARAEIESVLKQARAGADFATLAREHSQDGSAAQGGDLNYFSHGQMVEAFDKAAFSLKPGQISDVVTTQFGYHIIKVTDRKPAHVISFEEAKPRIADYLANQKKQEHAEAFINGLKNKAKIEVLI